MEEKRVAVTISTYNGEKYIEQQIESLLNQTYKNVDIFVRDDGSTDLTLDILKKYEKDKKIKLYYGENLGFIGSFYDILDKPNRI